VERQEREETSDEGPNEDERADEFLSDEEPVEESTEESAGEREATEGRPRRRRRRRRRPGDRGPRREPSVGEPMTDLETEEAFPSESPLGLSSADDDDEEESVDAEGDLESEEDEAPRVYRNVPTWEEAISYLLHRRPGESRAREGEPPGRRDGGRRSDRGERSHD
jgi:ribonuclease E